MTVAAVLRGKTVHPKLSATVSPGSRQVYSMIARNGALTDLIESGFRILESGCGPCIGMGQAPSSGAVTVRTFNRNFTGRSGTPDGRVYLCSPEVAAATALKGVITDPRDLGEPPKVEMPAGFLIDDDMIIPPAEKPEAVEILRGPNIQPLPLAQAMGDSIKASVLLKVGDNITTDHIMPAGARILPLRSNIPAMSNHVFEQVDADFPQRAKEAGRSIVVGGGNYGQGSSREHAALVPMYLGLKAVIAKSFARIHRANLVNFGIVPLTLGSDADYDQVEQGDELELVGLGEALNSGTPVTVRNLSKGSEFVAQHSLTPRQAEIVLAGGLLNHVKASAGGG
jgi:aconitate hydratase